MVLRLFSWLLTVGVLTFLLGTSTVAAQIPDWEWMRTASSDEAAGRGIARHADGSISVVGDFQKSISFATASLASAGSDDIFVVHYDAQGQVSWGCRAGGPGSDKAAAATVDADGNVLVTGGFRTGAAFGTAVLPNAGSSDVFVAKYTAGGALLWVWQAGGPLTDMGKAVAVDAAGNILVTGTFQSSLTSGATTLTASGPEAAFLIKLDGQGNILWTQTLTDSYAGGLATDSIGDVYVTGALASAHRLLAKYDGMTGGWLWATAPAGRGGHVGNAIAVSLDGYVYLTGSFDNTLQIGTTQLTSAGKSNGFLAKFTLQGGSVWVQNIGGPAADQSFGVAVSDAGEVGITGYFQDTARFGSSTLRGQSSCNCIGAFVAQYSAQGTCQWARSIATSGPSSGAGLIFDSSGNLTVTGLYQGKAVGGAATLPESCQGGVFTAHLTTSFPDLTVSAAQLVQGSYHHLTVSATGVATLTGPLQVTGTLHVQSGGVLDGQCQPVYGPGNFVLAAGSELLVCHPVGIASTGPTGAIQVTGLRSFSPDATYAYTGTVAQQTGSGLPNQVRALNVANSAGLRLTNALSIAQNLRLMTGDLLLNNYMLTLLSGPGGTASVNNAGGTVHGTATVQRYISPGFNAGEGYRHFSSPVQATTFADFATPTFTPLANPAYNSVPPPTPMPSFNVQGYAEQRLALGNPGNFNQGWYSPASVSAPLEVMRGYCVLLAGGQTVNFVGELNNGPYSLTLTRGSQPEAGWNLIGNPYPSTLDWSRVMIPTGLNGAMYVFQSSGKYTGQYRSYINGIGNPLIALGQGFMVCPSAANSSVQLTLDNSARSTDFQTAPALYRVDGAQPVIQLSLLDATSAIGAETIIYFEDNATAELDAQYDALQPQTDTTRLIALSSITAKGEKLAINGLPLPTAAPSIVPLRIQVPRTGQYRLGVEQFVQRADIECLLYDNLTHQSYPLHARSTYNFELLQGRMTINRFYLRFTTNQSTTAHTE